MKMAMKSMHCNPFELCWHEWLALCMPRRSTCVISFNMYQISAPQLQYYCQFEGLGHSGVWQLLCHIEARLLHISPLGHDIISKQKGQWFCHELVQEKNIEIWDYGPIWNWVLLFSNVKKISVLTTMTVHSNSCMWWLKT